MSSGDFNKHVQVAKEYDEEDKLVTNPIVCAAQMLVRADSMDVGNDPRFFAKNVMDKRLAAFKVLTLISSLMFSTALGQLFSLKKDMDFGNVRPYVGIIGYWQMLSFFMCLLIAIMCLLSLYIIAHQLFFTFRLTTAGPSGFDQAAIFYLTRAMTVWRHLAIKCLFNGLFLFLAVVGIQLFVKFYKDAASKKHQVEEVMVMNMVAGTSQLNAVPNIDKHTYLSIPVHVAIGYLVLFICVVTSMIMIKIRWEHVAVFEENYNYCSGRTVQVSSLLRTMASRSKSNVET
mmetsp:Transcript_37915/g.58983  ORF Transcript_37915/g.58983 Transcript_37915/m.58983 type:complete len:287 (+) Transcript_37915:129-989(+)